MFRCLSSFCTQALVFFAAWGGYLALSPAPPEGPALVIEYAVLDLGEQQLGEKALIYRITNNSKQPRNLTGPPEG